jgi:hypothetical protein
LPKTGRERENTRLGLGRQDSQAERRKAKLQKRFNELTTKLAPNTGTYSSPFLIARKSFNEGACTWSGEGQIVLLRWQKAPPLSTAEAAAPGSKFFVLAHALRLSAFVSEAATAE